MIKLLPLLALPLIAACATTANGDIPVAAADAPLTSWHFVSIDGASPVSPEARLMIWEDRISASAGCNLMQGPVELAEGKMVVGPLIATRKYCQGLMEQEQAISELLNESPSYFIENGRMAIASADHKAELVKAED